ncbi:TetR/AcrR family transcriptional regulator [Silvimonas iriomotensis]|uniref:HTH tetR-type domain-containing protein n=1 Tax=Silvimonas iriomotensis TaxID=449662 RepID=A0ABQ2PDA0_9NEIS|nr:TetR/AcrR family transcriptional regulator [Silvimonas iriomotensis]GGP23230.1 hypothetical protein GCM10010970_32300 [Silvimonas iriomotensis]
MRTDSLPTLDARKRPRQARSQATVDTIFEATIQVLLAEGLPRLTTIRVAERAGVSVGTLYQYYPQKQALLFAVLQRHLEQVARTVDEAALSMHGATLAQMVRTIVTAFVKIKTQNLAESRALYAVATELDSREYVQSIKQRNRAALEAMLRTASDARFADISTVTFMFAGVMIGPIQVLLEGEPTPEMLKLLPEQLVSVCLGYLEREALRPA